MLALADLLEAADGLLQGHVAALHAGELLRDREGLAQEALHLAGAGHDLLILVGQLVHAHDGDDVLQLAVALEDGLHLARHVVVLLAHDLGGQDAAGGIQRIHRRVDALGGDVTGQNRSCIQMGEGGCRGRVGQVVRRDVDRLHRGDGTGLGGGDALLQRAHLGSQRGLVADGGGHAAQQRGNLAARLGEAEDVVDEQQHVLLALVAEVLRHGQARQCHAHAGSRRLVHLAVDQRGLGEHAALLHFIVEVVSLAGSLANAGEHGKSAVLLGDVVDQLHDQYSLANARTAEQADLAALGVGRDQVDDLDARLQDLRGALLLVVGGCGAMDGPLGRAIRGRKAVDGVAQQVEHAAQALLAHRHRDRRAGVHGLQAAAQAVGGVHGDAAHHIVAHVLRDLGGDHPALVFDFNRIEQVRQVAAVKADVQNRTDDLRHSACILVCHVKSPRFRSPRLRRSPSAPG